MTEKSVTSNPNEDTFFCDDFSCIGKVVMVSKIINQKSGDPQEIGLGIVLAKKDFQCSILMWNGKVLDVNTKPLVEAYRPLWSFSAYSLRLISEDSKNEI